MRSIVWLCLFLSVAWGQVGQVALSTLEQQRYEQLTSELRCLVCQNESLAASTAPLATDLKRHIQLMITAGQTNVAIKQDLVAHYGAFVLFRPPWMRSTYVLWLFPFILLVVVLCVAVHVIRRARCLTIQRDL